MMQDGRHSLHWNGSGGSSYGITTFFVTGRL